MERFLSVRPPPLSNDIISAPKSINSKAVAMKEVIEFKLQGKNYIWCNALTKKLKLHSVVFNINIANQIDQYCY
jgi:hypothetical protein